MAETAQEQIDKYFREWQFWAQQVSKANSKTEARAALDKVDDCFRAWSRAVLQRLDESTKESMRPSFNARGMSEMP